MREVLAMRQSHDNARKLVGSDNICPSSRGRARRQLSVARLYRKRHRASRTREDKRMPLCRRARHIDDWRAARLGCDTACAVASRAASAWRPVHPSAISEHVFCVDARWLPRREGPRPRAVQPAPWRHQSGSAKYQAPLRLQHRRWHRRRRGVKPWLAEPISI